MTRKLYIYAIVCTIVAVVLLAFCAYAAKMFYTMPVDSIYIKALTILVSIFFGILDAGFGLSLVFLVKLIVFFKNEPA